MQRFSLHEPRLQNTARHPGLVMALFKQRFTSVFVKAAGQCRLSNCMRLPRCTVLKSVPMSLQRKSHGFQPVALQVRPGSGPCWGEQCILPCLSLMIDDAPLSLVYGVSAASDTVSLGYKCKRQNMLRHDSGYNGSA